MKSKLSTISALFLVLSFWLVGCHPRPVEDLAIADVALRAAQKAKADSLAPDLYRKAENLFLRAKKDYSEGYYDSARKFANESRMLSEQAEFKSLQKQTQLKDRSAEDVSSGGVESAPIPTPYPGGK